MYETEVALGVCTSSQVVASSSKKQAHVKTPEVREWVPIVQTIAARHDSQASTSHEREARKSAAQAAALTLDSMCTQWQK